VRRTGTENWTCGVQFSRYRAAVLDLAPELHQGLDNLRTHKLRPTLIMPGMIFGVAVVVAMLSIGDPGPGHVVSPQSAASSSSTTSNGSARTTTLPTSVARIVQRPCSSFRTSSDRASGSMSHAQGTPSRA